MYNSLLLAILICMVSNSVIGMARFNDILNRLTTASKKEGQRLKDDLQGEYWDLSESNQEIAREELLERGMDLEGIVSKNDIQKFKEEKQKKQEEMEWEQLAQETEAVHEETEWQRVPKELVVRSDGTAQQLESVLTQIDTIEKENKKLSRHLDFLKIVAQHNTQLSKENDLMSAREDDLDMQIAKAKAELELRAKQISSNKATKLLENANNNLRSQIMELEQQKQDLLKRLNQ